MIMAEEFNAFAKTPEQKARLHLENEAEQFVDEKRAGVLKGF